MAVSFSSPFLKSPKFFLCSKHGRNYLRITDGVTHLHPRQSCCLMLLLFPFAVWFNIFSMSGEFNMIHLFFCRGFAITKSKLHDACGRMFCVSFVIDVDTIDIWQKKIVHIWQGDLLKRQRQLQMSKAQRVIKPCQSNDLNYSTAERQNV